MILSLAIILLSPAMDVMLVITTTMLLITAIMVVILSMVVVILAVMLPTPIVVPLMQAPLHLIPTLLVINNHQLSTGGGHSTQGSEPGIPL
jgi:hypothetical protein